MRNKILALSYWWFCSLVFGLQLVFLRSTVAQAIFRQPDMQYTHEHLVAKQLIQRVTSRNSFTEKNRQAFQIGRKTESPIADLAIFVASDSCPLSDWEAASHIVSARFSQDNTFPIMLTSDDQQMVKGLLKLLLKSKVLRKDESDAANPNTGPIFQEFMPVFVAMTFDTSPTNRRLAIELLRKYSPPLRSALIALAFLVKQNDETSLDAHKALELLDRERYTSVVSRRPYSSTGTPSLVTISAYIQGLEFCGPLSDFELVERQLGFLDLPIVFWNSSQRKSPLDEKMDECAHII